MNWSSSFISGHPTPPQHPPLSRPHSHAAAPGLWPCATPSGALAHERKVAAAALCRAGAGMRACCPAPAREGLSQRCAATGRPAGPAAEAPAPALAPSASYSRSLHGCVHEDESPR